MKAVLPSAEWCRVFDCLTTATHAVAEIASLLDMCLNTDAEAEDAKRVEMDLNILESRLRKIRDRAVQQHDAA
jgi:hypothetical protein